MQLLYTGCQVVCVPSFEDSWVSHCQLWCLIQSLSPCKCKMTLVTASWSFNTLITVCLCSFADHGQAVLTPVCAVRRATTGDCDSVGVAYCIFCILQKKSHSHSRFCHGHWVASNISGVVKWSLAVYQRDHTITDSFWADTDCDLWWQLYVLRVL